jgi:glycosyltransferase involved in cell wall biosynthesis
MSDWTARAGRRDDAARFADMERAVRSGAQAVAVCSSEELTRLGAGGTARRLIVRHGVDPEEWPPIARREGPPAVGAIGNWDWAPNRSGITWFVEEVWPDLRARVPDAEFVVAGSGLPPDLSAVPGVRYLGRVADRADVVGRVDAMVVPVRSGVGAPVKLAEALAAGRPVMATTDAASAHPESPARVSDAASAWVDELGRLLVDGEAALEEGERARRFALGSLTWAQTTRPLVDWVRNSGDSLGYVGERSADSRSDDPS